ncbi:lysylphosphatidylglycerol synthase transmembrane domain-containing protein [Natronobacterium gregoryi]|uniref:TIGR00374 family protein n=2 Tax=Natronobacterium gregoryi TaxID=44930 RepID=L0AEW9_NATGS|nr:lysylphosphatidylglycerol synthase transmembrane domain-containing protein [Natronobacterium gregoryi]AFZ71590.1 hypothetical protein Natgr_0332 [Natronobacterium gregoryi SP2]ELY66645.1 hypothetical protein C490_12772 [Natronobacterium gregoryi SP2]PLK21357.1 TIGR00374 family protein [Natronobacterium gregoryi SP2]SFI81012.1 hypothetical protein SAMN05443661_10653 [Natronobacterium gregoryi]
MKRNVALWALGCGVLVLLVVAAGWSELRAGVAHAQGRIMVGLLALQVLTLGLIAYQWQFVLRRADVDLHYREVLAVTLAGGFVESVTPSSKLGGEAAKVYLFRRLSGAEYGTLSSALLVHKFVSLLPFFGLCLLFATVGLLRLELALPSSALLAIGATGALAGIVGGTLVLMRTEQFPGTLPGFGRIDLPTWVGQRVGDAIAFARDAVVGATTVLSPWERRWLYGISLVVWGLYPIKIYVVALMLGLDVSLFLATIGTGLAYLASIVPFSPGGLGSFEGVLAGVFVAGGTTFADGMAVSVLSRLVTFWFPLVVSALATAWLLGSDYRLSPDDLGLPSLSDRLRK